MLLLAAELPAARPPRGCGRREEDGIGRQQTAANPKEPQLTWLPTQQGVTTSLREAPPFHPHLAASAAELAKARRRPAGCRRWGRATTAAAARARRQLPLLNMLLLLDAAATGWGCTRIRAAVLVGRKGAAKGGHHADHH